MSGKLKNLLAWCMWPPECRPRLNVKAVIQGITIHITRIRRLWDLLDGIFILRVPIHLSGKQFIAYEGVTHIRGLAACVGAYRTSRTLTHLYNISLSSKIIPGEWKLARITPIYKGSGDVHRETNYRPISVLSHVAKIFERNVHEQIVNYLEHHCFITPYQ